jgi:predicted nuclease with TOPRIM domain
MANPAQDDGWDEFNARLARVEVDVAAIKATLPHLATKADLGALKAEFGELRGEFGELRGEFGELRGEFGELRGEFRALKAQFGELRGDVGSSLAKTEASLIKWVVGGCLACGGLAFSAAKLVS